MNKEIQALLASEPLQTVTVPKGAVICNEGQTCDGLVIVNQGLVSVIKRAEDGRAIGLYDIKKGESCILTLSCILNQAEFPAEAVAQSEVSGVFIPTDKVNEWFVTKPEWARYVLSVISNKLSDVIGLVDAMAFLNLDQRLTDWLVLHAQNDVVLKTHQEIAESVGSSREVISRILKNFENDGLVRLSRGKVELLGFTGLDTENRI